MAYLISTLIIGVGATALTDLWAAIRVMLFGVPPPDYGLVGRWVAHMGQGRFRHDAIKSSPSTSGEIPIGWATHYVIGIAYAGALLAVWGIEWLQHPTLGPALIIGVGTVAAPFLLMQPGMGAGIAASRTPHPTAARIHSLIMHTVFGLGLYGSGWMARLFL